MTAKPSENGVDWEAAKRCLAQIQRDAPAILQQGVIIGGIACWFYRNLLSSAQDPDFPKPVFSPAEEAVWLSKDIDFTNFFAPDARNLLSQHIISDSDGRLQLNVAGIPIGFAQVGVTFDPEQAWADSWIAAFESDRATIEFRVLDPISLYREKLALSQRRGVESDRLHRALLIEFLRCEACRQADALAAAASLEGRTAAAKFLFAIRDRATEVFDDARVSRRFEAILASSRRLSPSERRLLSEAVKRHS